VGAGAVDEGTAVEESHWTVVYGRGRGADAAPGVGDMAQGRRLWRGYPVSCWWALDCSQFPAYEISNRLGEFWIVLRRCVRGGRRGG
jgi:hypothetical protein